MLVRSEEAEKANDSETPSPRVPTREEVKSSAVAALAAQRGDKVLAVDHGYVWCMPCKHETCGEQAAPSLPSPLRVVCQACRQRPSSACSRSSASQAAKREGSKPRPRSAAQLSSQSKLGGRERRGGLKTPGSEEVIRSSRSHYLVPVT